MAEEKDTDRLASELLGKICDALNKPLPGTGKKTPKPQADDGDNSLLDTIKDFLTQALPGTKPIAATDHAASPDCARAFDSNRGRGQQQNLWWCLLLRRKPIVPAVG